MNTVFGLLKWLVKAALFFALFAFALNNQQEVVVHFVLGRQWQTPMVVVVLLSLAFGVVLGVLVMTPHWWRQRQQQKSASTPAVAADALPQPAAGAASIIDGH